MTDRTRDEYDDIATELVIHSCEDCGKKHSSRDRIRDAIREAAAKALEDELLYLQDLIPPGGSVCRSEVLARLGMKVDELRGMFKALRGKAKGG